MIFAQAFPASKKFNLNKLSDANRFKSSGCPTQLKNHAFEHLNMNVHDLTFRAQRSGTEVHLSLIRIMNWDWDLTLSCENSPVTAAFYENDRPLFHQLYQDNSRPIVIDLKNWRLASPIWERRFGSNRPPNQSMSNLLQKVVCRAKANAKMVSQLRNSTTAENR